MSLQSTRLGEVFLLVWRTWTGRVGIIVLGLMVLASIYTLLTMPLDYGTRVWSNTDYWKDYPKMVPPDWYRVLFDRSLLPHTVMKLEQPSSDRVINYGGYQVRVLTYTFTYSYESPTYPQNVRIAIYGVQVRNPGIPVVMSVSLERPDGKIDQLYFEIIRIPQELAGQKIYTPVPKDVNAYGNTYMASQLSSFFSTRYGLSINPADLAQFGVERAMFGAPASPGNISSLEPLNGIYRFTVEIQLTSPQDSVDMVSLAVVGRAYGIMGTDFDGRDLAQALLFGFPVALAIGFITSAVVSIIGMILGVFSGYYGGILDEVVQRTADVLGNIPLLPLLILFTFITPTYLRLQIIIITLIVFGWAGLAIIIRSMVLSIKAEQYVEAARALGASNTRIIFKHIIPQVMPYTVAQMIFFVPTAILTEAGLSLLGLGDPSIPTWGQILSRVLDKGAVSIAWWWILPPGLLIVLSAVTFVLIALALEPVVDPRLRRRA
ncbi:MAG TPA: ABC transporter permease [Sulfolobales archaeon]|nr:ABC transporter permease [Sulfolobales archaeon]